MCSTADSGGLVLLSASDRSPTAVRSSEHHSARSSPRSQFRCRKHCSAVTPAGGEIVTAAMDVDDQGRMAITADAAGARFGLWQGRAHLGALILNEPGALVWFDLITAEPEPVREFYSRVFEFDAEKLPGELDYTVLHRPDAHPVGGIQGEESATESRWMLYFEVEDVDTTLERATADGGKVTRPAQDSEFGRTAGIRDPFGVDVSIIRSAQPD